MTTQRDVISRDDSAEKVSHEFLGDAVGRANRHCFLQAGQADVE